jgi:tRNA pseudouridine55 synthase
MIHGLIPVNKSGGMTSHNVVEEIRKLFDMQKVGHFGTLDPLAEGLLLVGLGNATKFFDFYIKKRKLYSGKILFGFSTDTYDAEGKPISEKKEIDLRTIDIDPILAQFTGKIMQIPPLYSAKKFKGKPMYKYARENKKEEVELKPVPVEIYRLNGIVTDETTLWFRAETSSGTYIRSLAHDLGQKLGVGAFLNELKREGVGEFLLENAYSLDELTQCVNSGEISKVVIPIEALLPEFSKIIVSPGARQSILNGKPLLPREVVKIMSTENNDYFRLFDDEGKLLAIAVKDPKLMRFNPDIVFNN